MSLYVKESYYKGKESDLVTKRLTWASALKRASSATASPAASSQIRTDSKSCNAIVLMGSPGLFITPARGKELWTGRVGN